MAQITYLSECQRNANKEWLGDGAWRGGAGAITTMPGQCANTKFVVKRASVPIRSDDADVKMLPSCVVFPLRLSAFE